VDCIQSAMRLVHMTAQTRRTDKTIDPTLKLIQSVDIRLLKALPRMRNTYTLVTSDKMR